MRSVAKVHRPTKANEFEQRAAMTSEAMEGAVAALNVFAILALCCVSRISDDNVVAGRNFRTV